MSSDRSGPDQLRARFDIPDATAVTGQKTVSNRYLQAPKEVEYQHFGPLTAQEKEDSQSRRVHGKDQITGRISFPTLIFPN